MSGWSPVGCPQPPFGGRQSIAQRVNAGICWRNQDFKPRQGRQRLRAGGTSPFPQLGWQAVEIWALNCRAQNLKKKLGGKRYSPYSWRHGFITRKLREKMAINILSNLVASSVATIQKHYDHFSDGDVLQQAVGTKVA